MESEINWGIITIIIAITVIISKRNKNKPEKEWHELSKKEKRMRILALVTSVLLSIAGIITAIMYFK